MNVDHLVLLRDLSMRGSLAAVAQANHCTSSALSQQLRTAERDFGVKLVEPAGRGIRLTAAGEVLAESADEVLAAIQGVRSRLDYALKRPRGVVRIGSVPSAAAVFLPELFVRFSDSDIELDIDDFDLAESAYADQTLDVDIVIAHSMAGDIPPRSAGLVHTVLAHEPLDVALPSESDLASRDTIFPDDLVGTPWVGVPPGYPFDTIVTAIEQQIGQRLECKVRVRDNRIVEELVRAGVGLAVLPRFTTQPGRGLVLRPLAGVRATRMVSALSRSDTYERAAVQVVTKELVTIGSGLG